MEKCYRDIQSRGQIAGLSLLEVFILLAVPILLFPFFTLLNLNFGIILVIEILLYKLFRLAARVSNFDYGLASFVYGPDDYRLMDLMKKNILKTNPKILTWTSQNQKDLEPL